jgi:flavorubredoxin
MQLVVVYESMFGNTKMIAEAIAEGLNEAGEVTVGTVDDLAPEDAREAALIVVGGPTHNRGMAKPDARKVLAKRSSKHGAVLPGSESLRGWLERLPNGRAEVATFDTRFDKPALIVGSAARGAAQRIGDKGYEVLGSRSFFVRGSGGPLAEGERERAVAWGRELAVKTATLETAS